MCGSKHNTPRDSGGGREEGEKGGREMEGERGERREGEEGERLRGGRAYLSSCVGSFRHLCLHLSF